MNLSQKVEDISQNILISKNSKEQNISIDKSENIHMCNCCTWVIKIEVEFRVFHDHIERFKSSYQSSNSSMALILDEIFESYSYNSLT